MCIKIFVLAGYYFGLSQFKIYGIFSGNNLVYKSISSHEKTKQKSKCIIDTITHLPYIVWI